MTNAHVQGNQDSVDLFAEALSQLLVVIKEAANPKNTESLPFVTAEVMLEKLKEAFNKFEEMPELLTKELNLNIGL